MPETIQRSELGTLLEKNAYGEGLTDEEFARALEFILYPEISEKNCYICRGLNKNNPDPAIYDTNLCKGHAFYALVAQK